jgi:uncharacterized protein (DUF4213/DUF364 family)
MKSITSTYVNLAERIAARFPLPCVKALHLPAMATPISKDAEFCVLELEDGSCGFTYVWLGNTLSQLNRGKGVDRLTGCDPLSLARSYAHPDPASRALGMAAINALSQHLFSRAAWMPEDAADSLGQLIPQPGEHIGMVGLFPPLISRIIETGARLTVLELNPDLAGTREDYRVTLDPAELSGCVKVVSTSTVLLNDTLDAVLAACGGAHYFAMIGPTAGCLPDPLFARGVSTVGGVRIVDLENFLGAFHTGAPWGRFTRKYAINQASYPGVDWLLKRAS